MTDADAVPILVNRRILLQPFYALFGGQSTRAEPGAASLDVPLDYDGTGVTGMHSNVARTALHVEIDVTADLQCAFEVSFCFCVGRRTEGQDQNDR